MLPRGAKYNYTEGQNVCSSKWRIPLCNLDRIICDPSVPCPRNISPPFKWGEVNSTPRVLMNTETYLMVCAFLFDVVLRVQRRIKTTK